MPATQTQTAARTLTVVASTADRKSLNVTLNPSGDSYQVDDLGDGVIRWEKFGGDTHYVATPAGTCTCGDSFYRKRTCKHTAATAALIARRKLA